MTQPSLFRILGYLWLVFGAYWMGSGLLRRNPAERTGSSTRRVLRFGFLAITFALLFIERHRIPAPVVIILSLAWAMLGIYWTTSTKSVSSSGEFPLYRLLRLSILAVTFSLLFWSGTAIGFLGARLLPLIPVLAIGGFTLAFLGMAIATWARLSLGRFWSDKVVLQSGHQLIRTGPYARMRHPLYSGVLLGVLGTALLLDQWRGLLAFAILLLNYIIKAKKEEHLLAAEFGAQFAEHVNHAGFLLPRLQAVRAVEPHSVQR